MSMPSSTIKVDLTPTIARPSPHCGWAHANPMPLATYPPPTSWLLVELHLVSMVESPRMLCLYPRALLEVEVEVESAHLFAKIALSVCLCPVQVRFQLVKLCGCPDPMQTMSLDNHHPTQNNPPAPADIPDESYLEEQVGGGRHVPSPLPMLMPTRLRTAVKATARDGGLVRSAQARRSRLLVEAPPIPAEDDPFVAPSETPTTSRQSSVLCASLLFKGDATGEGISFYGNADEGGVTRCFRHAGSHTHLVVSECTSVAVTTGDALPRPSEVVSRNGKVLLFGHCGETHTLLCQTFQPTMRRCRCARAFPVAAQAVVCLRVCLTPPEAPTKPRWLCTWHLLAVLLLYPPSQMCLSPSSSWPVLMKTHPTLHLENFQRCPL